MLVTNNFSFFHSVFKRLILQTRKNQGLFGKGLINLVLASCSPDDHVLQVIDFQQTVNGTEWKKKLKIFLRIVMQVVYENTFKGNNFRKEDTIPIPTMPYFATFFFRNGLWVLHSPVVNGRNDNLDVPGSSLTLSTGFCIRLSSGKTFQSPSLVPVKSVKDMNNVKFHRDVPEIMLKSS